MTLFYHHLETRTANVWDLVQTDQSVWVPFSDYILYT